MVNGLTKTILKNTMFLYVRMLVLMFVSLITIRIVLDLLGPVDYGIFIVVGGFIAVLGFLNGTMTSASQRFFSFDLGLKNERRLNQTFSLTLMCYFFVASLILIFSETIGLWFVLNKLEIPIDRLDAAILVYHTSVISMFINLITIPFKALIVSYEHMNFFAIISIVESILKLLFILILYYINVDNLVFYSLIHVFLSVIMLFSYVVYCKKNFKVSKFNFYYDKSRIQELFEYSGWNLFGSLSKILKNHGVNILINILSFDLIVNTARSISLSFESALKRLSTNFYLAVRPQITKSYSSSNLSDMQLLVFQSSKLAYSLLLIISIPFYLEIDNILYIWLKSVPEYVEIFCKLCIVNALIEIIFLPIAASIQATGNISLHQKVTSFLIILNLPLCFLFLNLGYSPEVIIYISIFLSAISVIPRLLIQEKVVKIKAIIFFEKVILKLIYVTIFSGFLVFFIDSMIPYFKFKFIFTFIYSIIITISFIYIYGLDKDEKKKVTLFLLNSIFKK